MEMNGRLSGGIITPPTVTITDTEENADSPKFEIGPPPCSDEEEDLDEEEQYRIVPPDGGWGWVVVAASFMLNAIVDGIIFTSGMLYPKIRETFGVSNAEVAWISSLLGGFYLMFGPFVSALANAIGFRLVCVLGAVIGSAACVLSYFATNIYFLYVSFGVLGGCGFGLIYVPAVIATGFYFERRRALATGIAVCGSGIGTFIMSPLNAYLLSTLGDQWQKIFLVYAGIIITCAFFGIAFRPLTAATGKKVRITDEELDGMGTPLLIRISRARKQELANCASALSMNSMTSRSPSKITLEEEKGYQISGEPRLSVGNNLATRNIITNKRISVGGGNPLPILEEHHSDEDHSNNGVEKLPQAMDAQTVLSEPTIGIGNNLGSSSNSLGLKDIRRAKGEARTRRASRISLISENRPFYRDDIFYAGSMARLPQFQSSDTINQFHASVANIPPEEFGEPTSKDACCTCCPPSLRHVLSRMFDLSLLSSITFIFLAFSGFLALMSLFVPFNFLPSYAMDLGIEEKDVSFIMSLIGICNTFGRIIAGWISDHPKVDALMVNNLALIIGGVATICLPFMTGLSMLYLYAVIFGLCVAAFASLRSILLVELLGLEKLTNAFGLLLLFQGFAATFGSPIAGAFLDRTQEYNYSFYIFGSLFALSGIMCIPLRRVKKWEDDRIDAKLRREKYGVE